MRIARLALVPALVALACGGSVPPGAPVTARESAPPSALPTSAPTVEPTATPAPEPSATIGAGIDLRRFAPASGTPADAVVGEAGLTLGSAASGMWTSPWREPGFAFTRLVPSWNADTPEGTWITVEARARRASGGETAWYSFGKWASGDGTVRRTTVNGQRDGDARIDTDTLAASVPLVAYQLRLTLSRAAGTQGSPVVRLVTAAASDDAVVRRGEPSAPSGIARDLDVPMYSQEIHAGEYPQYAGGGEAWCSPTSVAMILSFWGKEPRSSDMAWIDPRLKDPQVIQAARATYDAAYEGTGNWAFNTAYAATYGLEAFVTQLRSLAEAERFIAAGIPLVVSLKIAPGALPGFLFPQGSDGHILVVRGFTSSGDVIVNEPAVLSNAAVRMTYPRAAFERAWMGGSGGTAYVIRPAGHALPEPVSGATSNW